jgi:hypothetical protein
MKFLPSQPIGHTRQCVGRSETHPNVRTTADGAVQLPEPWTRPRSSGARDAKRLIVSPSTSSASDPFRRHRRGGDKVLDQRHSGRSLPIGVRGADRRICSASSYGFMAIGRDCLPPWGETAIRPGMQRSAQSPRAWSASPSGQRNSRQGALETISVEAGRQPEGAWAGGAGHGDQGGVVADSR